MSRNTFRGIVWFLCFIAMTCFWAVIWRLVI
jgi:hypothetical protein